jgi:hypothetical protein
LNNNPEFAIRFPTSSRDKIMTKQLLIAVAAAFALAACGKETPPPAPKKEEPKVEAPKAPEAPKAEEKKDEPKKDELPKADAGAPAAPAATTTTTTTPGATTTTTTTPAAEPKK